MLATYGLGRRNAKKNGEWARMLEMDDIGSSGRAGREGSTTLSRRLQKLRGHGWPIASDKFGVYLAATPEELQLTIDDFRSRANVFENAAHALEHARKFMTLRTLEEAA
jgi:hypothetical protein